MLDVATLPGQSRARGGAPLPLLLLSLCLGIAPNPGSTPGEQAKWRGYEAKNATLHTRCMRDVLGFLASRLAPLSYVKPKFQLSTDSTQPE